MATKKKYNFTFFQDILRERRGGKYSSKKVWGFIVMILVSIAFIVDGLKFYTVNEGLFNTMAMVGTTLIGIGTFGHLGKKRQLVNSDEEQD